MKNKFFGGYLNDINIELEGHWNVLPFQFLTEIFLTTLIKPLKLNLFDDVQANKKQTRLSVKEINDAEGFLGKSQNT